MSQQGPTIVDRGGGSGLAVAVVVLLVLGLLALVAVLAFANLDIFVQDNDNVIPDQENPPVNPPAGDEEILPTLPAPEGHPALLLPVV
jgi:hypothetical protein